MSLVLLPAEHVEQVAAWIAFWKCGVWKKHANLPIAAVVYCLHAHGAGKLLERGLSWFWGGGRIWKPFPVFAACPTAAIVSNVFGGFLWVGTQASYGWRWQYLIISLLLLFRGTHFRSTIITINFSSFLAHSKDWSQAVWGGQSTVEKQKHWVISN